MRIIVTDAPLDRKINAIKAVRAVTGLGLKEAKECIDTAISGVPSVLEGVSAAGLRNLRLAGIICHQDGDDRLRLPLDKVQIMKELVETLMEEDRYKTAENILKALVSFERGE